jgi:hypothetical protein
MDIVFSPSSEYTYNNIECPVPAKTIIPTWYKQIKQVNELNIKSCMPFLDSLTHGYIQTTWTDIHVEHNENEAFITSLGSIPIIDRRDIVSMPIDESFYNIEFIWQRQWSVKLPDGYSALVTHPLNRVDLPFYTISGTVDFDKYHHAKVGNMPFYIKKGFSGIIPKGTPMYQIIPIRRDDWVSKKEKYNKKQTEEKESLRISLYPNAYKKAFWQKKSFD